MAWADDEDGVKKGCEVLNRRPRPSSRSAPQSGPNSARAPDRREEILAASRIVFAQKGYEAATVSEIVGRAGVAQGTFYLYFPSKLSILLALTEKLFIELTARVSASGSGARTLRGAVQSMVKAAFEHASDVHDVIAIVGSSGAFGEIKNEGARITTSWVTFFTAFIERWQALGQIDPVIDPSITAPILARFVGQSAYSLTTCSGAAPAQVKEVTRIVHAALAAPKRQ
jgi:AcrR family transcriptional regulator